MRVVRLATAARHTNIKRNMTVAMAEEASGGIDGLDIGMNGGFEGGGDS